MPHPPGVVLGANQYGKAEVRVVRITRDSPRHGIEDLNVSSQLRGARLDESFYAGDNALVVATDTQKNTVYAFAREHGIGSPEAFLLRLGTHFTTEFDWIEGGVWQAEQYSWARIPADGADGSTDGHDHAFVRTGQETRTAVVQIIDGVTSVVAGLTDLTVLKSTGSEFTGFPRDRYTTLAETTDRILATSVTARWRYTAETIAASPDWNALYGGIREVLLATFADVHSLALQQTLFAMGQRAIEAFPEVAEVRFSMPNKHHFLVDLSPFDMENPNEVFFAADRPYGLIEGSVLREGEDHAPDVWRAIPGFV